MEEILLSKSDLKLANISFIQSTVQDCNLILNIVAAPLFKDSSEVLEEEILIVSKIRTQMSFLVSKTDDHDLDGLV